MQMRLVNARMFWLATIVIAVTLVGCKKEGGTKDAPPAKPEEATKVEAPPAKAEEVKTVEAPPAKVEEVKKVESPPEAAPDAKVAVMLAKADLVDGTEDKVVSKCAGCALHRVGVLPDVSPKIDPDRSPLHAIMNKGEHVSLRLTFGSARHDDGNRAAIDDLFKLPLAPVRLHNPRAQLRCDPAAQGQVAGFSLLQLLAHGRHRHDGNAVGLAVIHQLRKIL